MAATDRASATSTYDSIHPHPGGILLDDKVHVIAGNNATTARASSLRGHAVDVTLDIADPSEPLPVAIVRIHCPDPSTRLRSNPRVVSVEGLLLLISVRFELEYELFLYDYEVPHLLSIPAPPSTIKHVKCFAVLPRGGQARGLLVAAIDYVSNSFEQRMPASSSPRRMAPRPPIANPPWHTSFLSRVTPDKAITVGEKKTLWADLDQGVILLSDFSNDLPVLQYIPVPSAGADPKLEKPISLTFSVGMCRDVTFADGVIKFVEIENRVAFTYHPQHATEVSMVKEAHLISSKKPSFPEPTWSAL
ncbi:unnamed protein product [Miscanthus lutarioriparius]|uniref:DUF1618 domain-containing protein n=1 Tax=Miscanthus lutarioriparius TaxID=422564 RepID=A0A811MXB1_9POAL|nr:unnamed protein product [Miscanthus lutarioriparius]